MEIGSVRQQCSVYKIFHQESKRNKVSVLEQPSADLNPREMQKNDASRSFEETLLNPRVKAFKFLQAQV